MRGRRKYGRPIRSDLLLMMVFNAAAAFVVLYFVFALSGVGSIIPERLAQAGLEVTNRKLALIGAMVPGAGIAFACLWYWLILTGRSRGLSWGAACIYGVFIAYGNTPFSGFLIGLLFGQPIVGALLGLALLLIVPQLLFATTLFGLIMGVFNGNLAQRWITWHRQTR